MSRAEPHSRANASKTEQQPLLATGGETLASALRRRLETEIGALPGVHMTGHLDDATSVLATHDLLLHTSRQPEPFGQVIVQALAADMD